MDRAEDYNFQKDVYSSFISMANYRVAGFLTEERRLCNNDYIFFYRLIHKTDYLLDRASKKGKQVAVSTASFLKNFKCAVNDEIAYLAFIHQKDLAPLSNLVLERMSSGDTRFKNAFNHYWEKRCQSSVKVLYYHYLITNSEVPKYNGLGLAASVLMHNKIKDCVELVKKALYDYDKQKSTSPIVFPVAGALFAAADPKPVSNAQTETIESDTTDKKTTTASPLSELKVFDTTQASNLPYLNYVYDNIVAKEYPASAILLSVLRSSTESASLFYKKVLDMNTHKAMKALRIGDASAKEVEKLCNMMRSIVQHPGTKHIFEERVSAEQIAPIIHELFVSEHLSIYPYYKVFMESCHNSVLNFYLRVAGATNASFQFLDLNHSESKNLLDTFISILPQIDSFLDEEITRPVVGYKKQLHKLKFTKEQCKNLESITTRSGHFPLFTAIDYLMSQMDDRMFEIAKRGLNIFFGQPVQDLNTIAQTMGISKERVRQLRSSCLYEFLSYPKKISRIKKSDDYVYSIQSEYDCKQIRSEEGVSFSNEYITICIALSNPNLHIIGDIRKALLRSSGSIRPLYLVPNRIQKVFNFEKFLGAIDDLLKEKRFYPYRDDLDSLVRRLINKTISNDLFYDIVKECRKILLKGYPDIIINNQIYFPANARKTIPHLIEDILHEFNRPMTSEEICKQLNERYPDLEQLPSKIGSNALRNSNIVAVSRSSTYALAEWNYTEKRGGTIRDIVEEYLNSLIKPIAPLSDICEYVAKFRDNIKASSIKANLLAESSNKFSLYYKNGEMFIGYSGYTFDESFRVQEKRQGRRSFKNSVALLEKFIQENRRFPYSSGVTPEEKRLNRFLGVCKSNIRKGLLEPDEQAAIDRIEKDYEQFKGKKERITKENAITWMDCLERYVTYITTNETLPPDSSEEAQWYIENKVLYDAGNLSPDKRSAFTTLVKIVSRMNQ